MRALRHRNFRLFFGGQLVSLIGTWMQSIAQSWLIYRLTGSALLLGLVGFAGQIPVFVLAPVGGAVADLLPRRAVVVATRRHARIGGSGSQLNAGEASASVSAPCAPASCA